MERILLKTTIPYTSDDWNIERFSLLRAHLASLEGAARRARFEADARDRKPDANGDDRDLVGLGESKYTQLWPFAVDVGGGLTARDCEGITAFRRRGGGCTWLPATIRTWEAACSICPCWVRPIISTARIPKRKKLGTPTTTRIQPRYVDSMG